MRYLYALVLLLCPAAAYSQTRTQVDWTQIKNTPNLVIYSTGSGAPSAPCVTGKAIYTDTTAQHTYSCTAPNIWTDLTGGSSGSGSGLSATATWAQIKAGTAASGSVTPTMTWAQIKAQ